ncbi:hypothetical protein HYH02_006054 [Chlamydomonas schloesseri]|uniref:m7GpppX diphosphatase n=1 Tax=Chlamydomonas schloesseri TaxID=2026947 RepID=A0A835WK09_9CHLO|nr:hypothetical protein HYH02_006054 [Chlamydomonas schloesseri]|eukprot:KAG2448698.1 hypothetical protein HYH02_006054 [Chlamydomonas schloesseri]
MESLAAADAGPPRSDAAPNTAAAVAQGQLTSLKDFEVVEVLNQDPLNKSIALRGRFAGRPDDDAVLLLARKPFDGGDVTGLAGPGLSLQLDFVNDIYSKYVGRPPPQHSGITVDLIYPATAKHVQKHREQKRIMVTETPELYERVVLPYIRAIPPARLQWVYNILEKKKEVERLIFEDPDPVNGFMLHPDLKWDQTSPDQLYCLALVLRRDLACLRDLTADHLPLLENVRDKGCRAIQQRYGVPPGCLRIFLHYQPSYYHLHVHFAHVALASPGAAAGKAVLLDDVIDCIKTCGSDVWRRRTLTYQLGEADELWRLLGGGTQEQQQ